MHGHKTKVVLEIKERSKEDINSSQVRKLFLSVCKCKTSNNIKKNTTKQNHCKLHQTCGPESLKSSIKQQVFTSLIKMSGHIIKPYN